MALAVLLKPYYRTDYALFLAYTAVAVRIFTRYCLHQTYRLDDYFIIGAAVKHCLLLIKRAFADDASSVQMLSLRVLELRVSIKTITISSEKRN